MNGKRAESTGNKRITRNTMPGGNKSPKTPSSPNVGSKGTTDGGKTKESDIQKVLDRLDKVKESLESKIDASILSQEFSAKQLSDKVEKVEKANSKVDEKCDIASEDRMGIKAQLKVHGTRLLEIEEKIEQIEREKRRNILVIDGLEEKEGERVREVVDRIFEDQAIMGITTKTEVQRRTESSQGKDHS